MPCRRQFGRAHRRLRCKFQHGAAILISVCATCRRRAALFSQYRGTRRQARVGRASLTVPSTTKRQIMAGNALATLVLVSTLAVSSLCAPTAAWAQSGIASIYAGGHTANGERARATNLTAAHRSLPFGTMVRITNRRNGHSVVVRINDRGPFVRGRIIDVTPAAAHALGFSGLTQVTLAVLGKF